jgi:uncharacterized protein with HEPN domain
MTEKSKKYVSDVLIAIQLIREFTFEITDFNVYDKDRKTQSAVERQLVIIGEALNRLRQIESEIVLKNDNQIIGFRNRLVHAYDSIDNSIVWAIINRNRKFTRITKNSLNLS